jgi:dTDP-4-dehydrorhamnose reductase
MKILLFGSTGYLGSFLSQKLKVDICDKGKNYDYIINCVGKPDVDFCEQHVDVSYESNYNFLKGIKTKYNSKIIHFSTYYVYDDIGECTENSNLSDRFVYMKHKIMSEKLLSDNDICFRIGKLFGNIDVNKQNKLTEHILTNDILSLNKVLFNPTSLRQVLFAIENFIENKIPGGTYNLGNKGIISSIEYGRFINEYLNTNKKISILDNSVGKYHKYGCLMSLNKISRFINLTKWEDDMMLYLNEWREKCLA